MRSAASTERPRLLRRALVATAVVIGLVFGPEALAQPGAGVAVAAATKAAPTPTIEGSPRVGQQLTAMPGTWPARTTLTYLWFADSRPLAQVPAKTFTPSNAHIGKRITVRVVAYESGNGITTRVSAATAPVLPERSVPAPPVLTSKIIDRDTRSIHVSWRPSDDGGHPITAWVITRSFQDDSGVGPLRETVPAATTSYSFPNLTPQILYRITIAGVNALGIGAPVHVEGIVPPRPMQPGTPVILGSPTPLSILRADPGTWIPADATLRYLWWVDNSPIGHLGDTNPEFYVDPRWVGKEIFVVVSAEHYPAWVSTAVQSEPIRIVEGPPGDAPPP